MPQISIEDLSISYRGPLLLDRVSARIQRGDKIGLLGRNGTGKTTLIRLLMGIERPESGKIEFEANTKIAWVPQDVPAQTAGSIEEIIEQGLPSDFSAPEIGRAHV